MISSVVAVFKCLRRFLHRKGEPAAEGAFDDAGEEEDLVGGLALDEGDGVAAAEGGGAHSRVDGTDHVASGTQGDWRDRLEEPDSGGVGGCRSRLLPGW